MSNGFAFDVCFKCNKSKANETCTHGDHIILDAVSCDHSLLQVVNLKMKHPRHLEIGSPLKRDEMLALLLYTGCDCNYDMCAAQRAGDYQKWRWFDYCLAQGISTLSECETGQFTLYQGLSGVQMLTNVTEPHFLVTHTSTTWIRAVAEVYTKGSGMLVEIDKDVKSDSGVDCCDVSWISKFPDEAEVLFSRVGIFLPWKCQVVDNSKKVQVARLTRRFAH